MKNIVFHFIYISILGFIGYQHYSNSKNDAQLLSEIDKTLSIDNDLIPQNIYGMTKGVKTNVDAQPNYAPYLIVLNEVNTKTESIGKFIIYQKNNIKDLKRSEMRDSISLLSQNILKSITNLEFIDSFKRESSLLKVINKESYWHHFKDYPKNILSDLHNRIALDQLMIADYCLTKSSYEVKINFDGFRIAVVPKKAFYYEGEDFEGQIHRIAYSKTSQNIKIDVNGITLPIKDGIAQYKAIATNVGEQTIGATATIKNPFTGNTETVKVEYRYEVLPKCSRDCVKKQ